MKIIFVIDDLCSGGAQRQLVNLALEFKKEGNQVTVLTYFQRDYYGAILRSSGVITKCIDIKHPIKRLLVFRKYLREQSPDLVISYLGVSNFICEFASLPTKKWKLVANERSANPVILKSFKSKFLRFFHHFADVVLTNSYCNRDMILKVTPFLSEKKVRVIYNMIDLDLWSPNLEYKFKEHNKLKIVVAASHRYLKNLKGLLEAVSLLNNSEKEQLKIIWFGNNLNPPFYDNSIIECRDFINLNGLNTIVQLSPATHEINKELQNCDVVGLFSFFEGLPNAVCEGMALGKPILATSISDVPLLIEDGINGKLCQPDNINSIAEGLRYFLNCSPDKLSIIGKKNRVKALELFLKSKIFNQYKQVF